MPSSRGRISSSPTETREELFYDKDKLLANGDRWEARDRGQPAARRAVSLSRDG